MTNKHIRNAQVAKQDEFYTRYEDIERKMSEYKNVFDGKIVYCNCDDYTKSNFVKYFKNNFYSLGLKKPLYRK